MTDLFHNVRPLNNKKMTYPYILTFKNTVSLKDDGDGLGIVLITPTCKLKLNNISPGMRKVLEILLNNGDTEDRLCNVLEERDGSINFAEFFYILYQFKELGLIQYIVNSIKGPLVTLESVTNQFKLREKEISPDRQFCLSRFAYCHRGEGRLVLETPRGFARITLHNYISTAILSLLSTPRTANSLCEIIREINIYEAKAFLGLLFSMDAVFEVDGKGTVIDDEDTTLSHWEFHDLLFHARSRYGRHDSPAGGTYRFLNKAEPLPAVKPKMEGETIALYKPDIEKLKKEDIPFTCVIEERRSIREYAGMPLTVEQVGEFLYRCARIRKLMDAIPEKALYSQVSNRPYAGGGAIYELELYLTVNRCRGLENGMYHYCPKDHDLTRISGFNENLEKLLIRATGACGKNELPDILITYATRFQRFMWKYQSMAYAVILKDVGCLMQNMYLVATAMELAPCAIGDGDSDLFAEASGLDYYTEGSVGEFILGSKKKSD